jgi:hypothetical protein
MLQTNSRQRVECGASAPLLGHYVGRRRESQSGDESRAVQMLREKVRCGSHFGFIGARNSFRNRVIGEEQRNSMCLIRHPAPARDEFPAAAVFAADCRSRYQNAQQKKKK